MMGFENVVGKIITSDTLQFPIIGVINDFSFKPAYEKMEPLIIFYSHDARYRYLFLKINGEKVTDLVDKVEATFNDVYPDIPFDYAFLDEDYDKMYRTEERQGELFSYFTFLAIFISCLGLFGLASFTTAQRTKEIGIRKVMGSSVNRIVVLLSTDFTKWVLVSFVISVPLAYYFLEKWLQNFAFKTDLSWWIFVVSGTLVMLTALLTVSWISWRAAIKKPVESLQYE